MLPTGRANAKTTKANCALCDVSKLNTDRWLLLPSGLQASANVEEEIDGQKRLVPLMMSTSFRQLKPQINELVRSYNMSADMGGCAEVHAFTVPVLWPSKHCRTASAGDPVTEHNYWRNPKWLTKGRANQVHELQEACMQSIRLQASVDSTSLMDFDRWMATARCVSQIDPYTSLNHMHIHGLAGKRRWIDNYEKIMWATIKMEPNLYKDLALPGERLDGFGAAVELGDLERALRKGIEIRVNETITERARSILRIMEDLLKDNEDLQHQPLSEQARAGAEIAAEQAYQRNTSLPGHLQPARRTAGGPPSPADALPTPTSPPVVSPRQEVAQDPERALSLLDNAAEVASLWPEANAPLKLVECCVIVLHL